VVAGGRSRRHSVHVNSGHATAPSPDLAGYIAGYARRLHAAAGDRHHVASPLGAWLLLALAGPASSGRDRAALTDALGCDPDVAAPSAAELLTAPHPLVACAAAAWTRRGTDPGDGFRQWRLGLPDAVEAGDLPGKAGLDAWAREHTFGLINTFPLDSAADVYLLLATALATRVSWQVPFALASAAELGAGSAWSRSLGQVLRTPDPALGPGHRQFIAADADAGDVAVQAATARDGLAVYSVAAAPDVPAASVLAAAYRIGCADAIGAPAGRRDLADLPLGDGPAWMLREEQASDHRDLCTAVLPAWSAQSQHDLSDPGLGFGAAMRGLLANPSDPWAARQAAMARFTRTGFEAAAVTMAAGFLALRPATSTRRVAELRFGHPYAAVAVATDGAAGSQGSPAWHGVPVFSAWVAEPDDAADGSDGEPGAEREQAL
jgi:hypothetical protein